MSSQCKVAIDPPANKNRRAVQGGTLRTDQKATELWPPPTKPMACKESHLLGKGVGPTLGSTCLTEEVRDEQCDWTSDLGSDAASGYKDVLSWALRDPVNIRVQLPGEAEGNLKVTRDHEVVARR